MTLTLRLTRPVKGYKLAASKEPAPKIGVRGVIVGVQDDITITDILEETGAFKAVRITKTVRGRRLTTTAVLLDFKQDELPEHVYLGVRRFKVRQFNPTVTRCFNCQEYGHIARTCRSTIVCPSCSGRHAYENCMRKEERRCPNCQGSHAAAYKGCTSYKEAVVITRAAAATGMTYAAAARRPACRQPIRVSDAIQQPSAEATTNDVPRRVALTAIAMVPRPVAAQQRAASAAAAASQAVTACPETEASQADTGHEAADAGTSAVASQESVESLVTNVETTVEPGQAAIARSGTVGSLPTDTRQAANGRRQVAIARHETVARLAAAAVTVTRPTTAGARKAVAARQKIANRRAVNVRQAAGTRTEAARKTAGEKLPGAVKQAAAKHPAAATQAVINQPAVAVEAANTIMNEGVAEVGASAVSNGTRKEKRARNGSKGKETEDTSSTPVIERGR